MPVPSPATNRPSPQNVVARFIENKNVPIEFYGRVIDQTSNALAGVSVKIMVVQLTMPNPTALDIGERNIPIEKATGADGRFEISGVEGASFDLQSISKEGYEAEPPKRGHAPTGGTFDQPIIFKMWNTNIHEQLIIGEKKFQIIPDGRPYFINLTTGTICKSGTGDLKVWIQYPSKVVRGRLYDWSSDVEVTSGGLEAEDNLNASMYSAPMDGYTPSFQVQQQIKGGQHGLTGEKRFFVKLKNGQEYGRITINLYAPYTDQISGLIHLSYAINPSGSRILR